MSGKEGAKNSATSAGSVTVQLAQAHGDAQNSTKKQEPQSPRKQLGELLYKQRRCRGIIANKEAEIVAITKLVEIEHKKGSFNIRQLKRLKEKFEFKLTTEARSLADERELIRHIGEVDAKIDYAYRIMRLKRRSELLAGDIVRYKAELEELRKKIREAEASFAAANAHARGASAHDQYKKARHGAEQREKPAGINIEDIAIIDKRSSKD